MGNFKFRVDFITCFVTFKYGKFYEILFNLATKL